MNQQTLFVYYKVPQAEHDRWLGVVQELQKCILDKLSSTGKGLVEASLLRRPEVSSEGLETWMEVYEHPSGIDQGMVDLINEQVQQVGLPFKRAAEFFIPLAR